MGTDFHYLFFLQFFLENSEEQDLFEIEIFCDIKHAWFNWSLLNKSINFLQNKYYCSQTFER